MRLRMEPTELRFMIEVIYTALERIKEMKRQHKELKQDVWRLRDEVQKGGSHLIKALIKAREQLEQDKWKEQYIYDYQQACNLMLRRLERVLEGGRPHRHRRDITWFVERYIP